MGVYSTKRFPDGLKHRPLHSYIEVYEIPSIENPAYQNDRAVRKNKDELIEYLRDYDSSLQSTDSIEILDFEYGVKILYYHKEGSKPYKTRIYLNKMGDTKCLI